MKLKVNDRVKAKSSIFRENGKIGTIVKTNNSTYTVNFDENVGGWEDPDLNIKDGHGVHICEENLILINKITRQELLEMPAGTKIYTDAEDEDYQVWVKTSKNCFYDKNGNSIDKYDIEDNLELDTDLDFGKKIIKIEKPTYETVYDYSTEVQEMTVAEIEIALGHAVKIIKEDK